MNILITGGNGYVGRAIASSLSNSDQYQITSITRKDLDLLDSDSTDIWFDNKKFDVLIHTAISGGSRLKEDDNSVYEQNVLMFENIMKHTNKFDKMISFGSGAEIFFPETPYGKSKKWIANRISKEDKCFNIRIFGVFDHNELSTRFIKGNIIRYINKQPMIVHSDKIMDFYYMDDLVDLVKFYISNSNPPKIIDCSYEKKYSLTKIADFINRLDRHRVSVIVEQPSNELKFYHGVYHGCPIKEIGLHNGIIKTYERLKNAI